MVAPSESEPVSPMNSWAGWTLNHRKPNKAPTRVKQKRADEDLPLHQGDPAISGEDGGGDQPGQPIQPIGEIDRIRMRQR